MNSGIIAAAEERRKEVYVAERTRYSKSKSCTHA